MKKLYRFIERVFERVTSTVNLILGNSITFILALCTVVYWFAGKRFSEHDLHDKIGDVILGLTFLTLFVIQKSFNRFAASIHLKINGLIASSVAASNKLISVEDRSEHEIAELSKEYAELMKLAKETKEELVSSGR